jgi:hypothetical protein
MTLSLVIIGLLSCSATYQASAQNVSFLAPNNSILHDELEHEGSILLNELQWAENALKMYNQRNNKLPVRSPITHDSMEWIMESANH